MHWYRCRNHHCVHADQIGGGKPADVAAPPGRYFHKNYFCAVLYSFFYRSKRTFVTADRCTGSEAGIPQLAHMG